MAARLQGLENEIMDIRKEMEKVGYRDIIGGIGYIIGVWGLIMLIKWKKDAS
jgi:nickel transport protein